MVELVAQGVNAFSDLFSMNASFIIYTIITKPDKIFNVRVKKHTLNKGDINQRYFMEPPVHDKVHKVFTSLKIFTEKLR